MRGVRAEGMTYPACWEEYNSRKCQKKMQDNNDGSGNFYCERCAKASVPMWRFLLQCSFSDFTGTLEHVSIFGEAGDSVMGMTAGEVHEVRSLERGTMSLTMSVTSCSSHKDPVKLESFNI
jgi:hypothetical protein